MKALEEFNVERERQKQTTTLFLNHLNNAANEQGLEKMMLNSVRLMVQFGFDLNSLVWVWVWVWVCVRACVGHIFRVVSC